jgi:hypothetical protein
MKTLCFINKHHVSVAFKETERVMPQLPVGFFLLLCSHWQEAAAEGVWVWRQLKRTLNRAR